MTKYCYTALLILQFLLANAQPGQESYTATLQQCNSSTTRQEDFVIETKSDSSICITKYLATSADLFQSMRQWVYLGKYTKVGDTLTIHHFSYSAEFISRKIGNRSNSSSFPFRESKPPKKYLISDSRLIALEGWFPELTKDNNQKPTELATTFSSFGKVEKVRDRFN